MNSVDNSPLSTDKTFWSDGYTTVEPRPMVTMTTIDDIPDNIENHGTRYSAFDLLYPTPLLDVLPRSDLNISNQKAHVAIIPDNCYILSIEMIDSIENVYPTFEKDTMYELHNNPKYKNTILSNDSHDKYIKILLHPNEIILHPIVFTILSSLYENVVGTDFEFDMNTIQQNTQPIFTKEEKDIDNTILSKLPE